MANTVQLIPYLCVQGVLVLMKQNGQYRHQKLKEIRPEKVDMTGEDVPYQPHSVSISLSLSLSPLFLSSHSHSPSYILPLPILHSTAAS